MAGIQSNAGWEEREEGLRPQEGLRDVQAWHPLCIHEELPE